MRVVVAGLGIQGRKRQAVAGMDCVATVDPVHQDADYKSLAEVPLERFDAALVCTPDEPKIELLCYLLKNRKHALVEKPIFAERAEPIEALAGLARKNRAVCYTAYNHRFEPHFVGMKRLIDSGVLGRIYRCRMFYGNGTARDVRNSPWRDNGAGVLPDLGSHLFDTVLYWFGAAEHRWSVTSCSRFENAAFDHVTISGRGSPEIELEMTLLSWRNHFTCDVFAELGSAHIESLCKWGPSSLILRKRKLPSGRPDEEITTLVQPDPTWALEYDHFKQLCAAGGSDNLTNDAWINDRLRALTEEALGGATS
jgi:scyllo-inositol 2-dehydrogenase (NADP+)